MTRPSLTRAHRALLGVVAGGACVISGIGFAGSYNSVRLLAMHKGFGSFSYAFPIGVDAGIVVLLALDLVLTWLRIPFPLLRHTAWLLTAATIAFNAAASWGDPLGMAMHAVIPVLFVVIIEASRHAVGRIAAITADRHMESVRLTRWMLSPVPTFRLWRRMKLWELRSYDETVRLEQNRLVYRAQLRFRYGRNWRRSAPFQALLPLKLAKYGVPLDPTVLDRIDGPIEVVSGGPAAVAAHPTGSLSPSVAVPALAKLAAVRLRDLQESVKDEAVDSAVASEPPLSGMNVGAPGPVPVQPGEVVEASQTAGQSPWFKPPRNSRPGPEPARPTPIRVGPRPIRLDVAAQQHPDIRQRQEPRAPQPTSRPAVQHAEEPSARRGRPPIAERPAPGGTAEAQEAESAEFTEAAEAFMAEVGAAGPRPLDVDQCFDALLRYRETFGQDPDPTQLADYLTTEFSLAGTRPDGSVDPVDVDRLWPELGRRFTASWHG